MEKTEKELLEKLFESLAKRIDYIESLESIQHPTHLKEIINDILDRLDELELQNKNRDLY